MDDNKKDFVLTKKLDHIAFIMDGNGRWAASLNKSRSYGHKKGIERIKDVFSYCKEFNIKHMSFFAFSTENWNRPKKEINLLFNYLETFLNDEKEIKFLFANDARLLVSGDISKLPKSTQEAINKVLEKTKNNKTFYFNLCLNYGGIADLVKSTKEISKLLKDDKITLGDIDASLIKEHLYSSRLPSIDLLVRTSGEQRISNFMLFDLAYSELIFTKTHWPAFDKETFIECLKEYENRNRRYGSIKE